MATGVPSMRRTIRRDFALTYAGKVPRRDVLSLTPTEPVEIPILSEAGRLFQGDNLPAHPHGGYAGGQEFAD